jgi:DNA-binding NtrC family response regulator
VRLITATNRDLRAQVAAGAFREDLYYRLNVIQIHVPPLRERTEDILPLLDYYLERMAQAHERPKPALTADAAQMLLGYEWPGNVRELKNVTERLVLHDQSCPLTPADLPREIRGVAAGSATTAAPSAATPDSSGNDRDTAERVQRLWDRMQNGEDFWTVVHQPFKARELTRADLLGLVDRGLKETRGSYRALLKVFHLAPSDYKRFHAFLYQQHCNLAVAPYRSWQGSSQWTEADANRRLGRLSIAG